MARALRILLSLACGCGAAQADTSSSMNPPAGAQLARSKLARAQTPVLTQAERSAFAEDNQAFSLALYRELATEPGNLFFSPYSISSALAMTYAGAEGQTATEMASALHFGLDQPKLHEAFNATAYALDARENELARNAKGDGFRLELVNQAWGRQGYAFADAYLDVLGRNYGAGLFLLDFSAPEPARALINGWVEEQTHSRIQDLLPKDAIDTRTALVLTNAIYFKASWATKFDPEKTTPAAFHAPAGERQVPMMHAALDALYAEVDGFEMVALPYISDNVSMLLILPPAGKPETELSTLDGPRLTALQTKLGTRKVVLSLPQWRFESTRELKAPLQTLGMRTAFEPGAADFSGMGGAPGDLYIDGIYHKAFIAVDEQGTEAAAATAVTVGLLSLPATVELSFDRPFMFMVYDHPTGQIVFVGRVSDPS